jgi:hypothetical protein
LRAFAKIKAIDDAGKLGEAASHRCFAERARGQPFFVALTRQAQALLDILPLK